LLAACAGPGAAPAGQPVTPATNVSIPSSSQAAPIFPENFDVEGHRGARGLKPENTLPAFETALDLGVTTLELDLHYTADGHVVIWHDDRVVPEKCRLDPNAEPPLPPDPDDKDTFVDALMFSQLDLEQVQKYICDRNPDPSQFPDQDSAPTALAGANYHIATLDELFDFVDRYAASPDKTPTQRENALVVQFNIETKRKPDRPEVINDGFDGENVGPFEQAILEIVAARGVTDRVIVQSFDHRSLWAIHRAQPAIRLAALTSRSAQPAAYAEQGASIWSPRATTLTPRLLEQAHAAGLKVIPWTVNEPDDLRRLLDMGVDGIITDRPDLLLGLALD
jgi:glycerophosphoryl diester phosphodiesterase